MLRYVFFSCYFSRLTTFRCMARNKSSFETPLVHFPKKGGILFLFPLSLSRPSRTSLFLFPRMLTRRLSHKEGIGKWESEERRTSWNVHVLCPGAPRPFYCRPLYRNKYVGIAFVGKYVGIAFLGESFLANRFCWVLLFLPD